MVDPLQKIFKSRKKISFDGTISSLVLAIGLLGGLLSNQVEAFIRQLKM